jgi:hypothetical protein
MGKFVQRGIRREISGTGPHRDLYKRKSKPKGREKIDWKLLTDPPVR